MPSCVSVFIVTLVAVVLSPAGTAQCKDSVVGTWRLVSVKATTDKGGVDQTRFVTMQGDRMFVRNTPQLRAGVTITIESVWERLK
jgi:hypothetical protein